MNRDSVGGKTAVIGRGGVGQGGEGVGNVQAPKTHGSKDPSSDEVGGVASATLCAPHAAQNTVQNA